MPKIVFYSTCSTRMQEYTLVAKVKELMKFLAVMVSTTNISVYLQITYHSMAQVTMNKTPTPMPRGESNVCKCHDLACM